MPKGFGKMLRNLKSGSLRKLKRKRPAMTFFKSTFVRSLKTQAVMQLQELCKSFRVPFEPAKLYQSYKEFSLRDFSKGQRILVRTEHKNSSFTVPSDQKKSAEVSEQVRKFVEGKGPFLVQRVGPKENIDKFGAITIAFISSSRSFESKSQTSSPPTFFVTYGEQVYAEKNWLEPGAFLVKPENYFESKNPKLSKPARTFLRAQFGGNNVLRMLDYLMTTIPLDNSVNLRFVKYKGQKHCFYDMR